MSCNASRSSSSISTIISDVYSGGYEAAKYILKQGHTKIAYIGHTDNSVNLDEKIAGTRKAFDEFGVPFLEQYFYKGPSLYSTGYLSLIHICSVLPDDSRRWGKSSPPNAARP